MQPNAAYGLSCSVEKSFLLKPKPQSHPNLLPIVSSAWCNERNPYLSRSCKASKSIKQEWDGLHLSVKNALGMKILHTEFATFFSKRLSSPDPTCCNGVDYRRLLLLDHESGEDWRVGLLVVILPRLSLHKLAVFLSKTHAESWVRLLLVMRNGGSGESVILQYMTWRSR